MRGYIKIRSKYERKYGRTLEELSKELEISKATICKWEMSGFDIFDRAGKVLPKVDLKSKKYLNQLWGNMKQRCGNPNAKGYKYYGGKGIKIKITKQELIDLWVRDNGRKLKKPSIDRIDSDKDYELSNCRFIEMTENSKRITTIDPSKHQRGADTNTTCETPYQICIFVSNKTYCKKGIPMKNKKHWCKFRVQMLREKSQSIISPEGE